MLDARSKLFRAIVVMGAAVGAGCGGKENAPANEKDAELAEVSADTAIDDTMPVDVGSDVGPETADADICSLPDSEGRACGNLECCQAGQCWPCFI